MAFASIVPLNFDATPIVAAVKALYGVATRIDEYVDSLIDQMKSSASTAISRTGRILEGAKYGFGIGYIVPIVVIAAGQFLLGNTLGALSTVSGAVVLTNPVASTCAAVGAIYYGWEALTDSEKKDILDKLAQGLAMGTELVRSILAFVIGQTKAIFSPENLNELKEKVRDTAASFGKNIADITRSIQDRTNQVINVISDSLETVSSKVKGRLGTTESLPPPQK